jgi:hypothetical protein
MVWRRVPSRAQSPSHIGVGAFDWETRRARKERENPEEVEEKDGRSDGRRGWDAPDFREWLKGDGELSYSSAGGVVQVEWRFQDQEEGRSALSSSPLARLAQKTAWTLSVDSEPAQDHSPCSRLADPLPPPPPRFLISLDLSLPQHPPCPPLAGLQRSSAPLPSPLSVSCEALTLFSPSFEPNSTSRKFVNDTFAKCTDANRKDVEKELKATIYDKYDKGELESTDWTKVKLQRCVALSFFLPMGRTVLTMWRDDDTAWTRTSESTSLPFPFSFFLLRLWPSSPSYRAGFIPSYAVSNASSKSKTEENDLRAKRAKRFEDERIAAGVPAGGSLAGRLGSGGRLVQGGVEGYGEPRTGTPDSTAAYDPVRSPPLAFSPSLWER